MVFHQRQHQQLQMSTLQKAQLHHLSGIRNHFMIIIISYVSYLTYEMLNQFKTHIYFIHEKEEHSSYKNRMRGELEMQFSNM